MENNKALLSEFEKELENILGWWETYTIDKEEGGFYGELNNDNEVIAGAIKGSVLNARILWSFSAAYDLTHKAHYLETAARALAYIENHFLDPVYGGIYWSVDAKGIPSDTKKQIYAIAFTIYGLTAYHRAKPDKKVLDLAKKLYEDIERYSYDPVKGGYMEALTREWAPVADLRLSEKDANEKKTMNTHLHILEAYTNLYRVWPDEGLHQKIRLLLKVFEDHIVDPKTSHLILFFGEGWEVRSDIVSYGHDIEASWLLVEAAEVLDDAELLRRTKEMAVKIADASVEGLNTDGSMSYELDRTHGHLIAERHWWVQAEAMVGFFNAGQMTGEEHYYRKFLAAWNYTRSAIIDKKKGEWFWGRNADGSVMEGQDKAGFWKCPYHNSRACMEIIRRLTAPVQNYTLTVLLSCMVTLLFLFHSITAAATPRIFLNQVGFTKHAPKEAVIECDQALDPYTFFCITDATSSRPVFSGLLSKGEQLEDWAPGKWFYKADFSGLTRPGRYHLHFMAGKDSVNSATFTIDNGEQVRNIIGSIIHYYNRQRANTPEEWAADQHLQLFGSDKRVDLRGGWCDASGDVSKYFSHLAYANFMSPQQIPLVTWSMAAADETMGAQLIKWDLKDSLEDEALWGADYILRSLSEEGYFYMTVFSYFKKDPAARRVVGLRANSVTTNEYQCAFREGGGMAIAALARISRWPCLKDQLPAKGHHTSAEYLAAAQRAFAHLLKNNTRYDDDGKENIIDDYCALMAATELWIATDSIHYQEEARKRAEKLTARMTAQGYFLAGDTKRPFWHASDAGLPIVALCRYAGKEQDPIYRAHALNTIKKALAYNLRVTDGVNNPFMYARQTFLYKDSIKDGFFIPHENETGWWWQGENARLGSLATAALIGSKLLYSDTSADPHPSARTLHTSGVISPKDSLTIFARRQMDWILGCNPYSICFMYGFGYKNVPYMASSFGHGSERGGISNGITGKEGNADGSGIDFRTSDNGNEWRWTEQWLPHAAWFLQALAASAQ